MVVLLFSGHMLLFFENHKFTFLEDVHPILVSPSRGWRWQGPLAGHNFEKIRPVFDFNDSCEFLVSPSRGWRGQWPPAGQDFEKMSACL